MTPGDDLQTVYCRSVGPLSEAMAASVSNDPLFAELALQLGGWKELACSFEPDGPVILKLAGPALDCSPGDALRLDEVRDIGIELPELGSTDEPVTRAFITVWDTSTSPPTGSFRVPDASESARAPALFLSDPLDFQRAFKYATRAPLGALGEPDACLAWVADEENGLCLTGSSRDPSGRWYSAASATIPGDKTQVLSDQGPLFTRIGVGSGGRVPHGCVALGVETLPTVVRTVPLAAGNQPLGAQEHVRVPAGDEWDAATIVDQTIAGSEVDGTFSSLVLEVDAARRQTIELLRALWPDTTAWQRGLVQVAVNADAVSLRNAEAGTEVAVPVAQVSAASHFSAPGPVALQLLEALTEGDAELRLDRAGESAFRLERQHGDCYRFQLAT